MLKTQLSKTSFGGHLKIVNNMFGRKERDLTSYPYLKAYKPSQLERHPQNFRLNLATTFPLSPLFGEC
jgi:hypothetical protein